MAKVYRLGELDIGSIDDANVPVNIFLEEKKYSDVKEDNENAISLLGDFKEPKPDDNVFVLSAGNFMPRKERIEIDAYIFMSTDKQELLNIVQGRIVPLYEAALANLKSKGENYYWG